MPLRKRDLRMCGSFGLLVRRARTSRGSRNSLPAGRTHGELGLGV